MVDTLLPCIKQNVSSKVFARMLEFVRECREVAITKDELENDVGMTMTEIHKKELELLEFGLHWPRAGEPDVQPVAAQCLLSLFAQ